MLAGVSVFFALKFGMHFRRGITCIEDLFHDNDELYESLARKQGWRFTARSKFLAKSRRGAARLLWRASVCLNVDLLAGVLVCFVRVCFGCSVL